MCSCIYLSDHFSKALVSLSPNDLDTFDLRKLIFLLCINRSRNDYIRLIDFLIHRHTPWKMCQLVKVSCKTLVCVLKTPRIDKKFHLTRNGSRSPIATLTPVPSPTICLNSLIWIWRSSTKTRKNPSDVDPAAWEHQEENMLQAWEMPKDCKNCPRAWENGDPSVC